jgi:hypothetical protein
VDLETPIKTTLDSTDPEIKVSKTLSLDTVDNRTRNKMFRTSQDLEIQPHNTKALETMEDSETIAVSDRLLTPADSEVGPTEVASAPEVVLEALQEVEVKDPVALDNTRIKLYN